MNFKTKEILTALDVPDEQKEMYSETLMSLTEKEGLAVYNDPLTKIKSVAITQKVEGYDWAVICAVPYQQFFGQLGKLQEIIKDLKNSKEALISVGGTLKNSSDATANAISNIIENIEAVHSQIENSSENVTSTASAVNQIASNIQSLEKMIRTQSDSVSDASAAIEELLGNIVSIINTVVDKSKAADTTFRLVIDEVQEALKVPAKNWDRLQIL